MMVMVVVVVRCKTQQEPLLSSGSSRGPAGPALDMHDGQPLLKLKLLGEKSAGTTYPFSVNQGLVVEDLDFTASFSNYIQSITLRGVN